MPTSRSLSSNRWTRRSFRRDRGSMTLRSNSRFRVLFTAVAPMTLGAGFAIYFAFQLVRSGHPDTEARIVYPLILSVIAMLGGLMRFVYRNKRNYYAELKKQRRS